MPKEHVGWISLHIHHGYSVWWMRKLIHPTVARPNFLARSGWTLASASGEYSLIRNTNTQTKQPPKLRFQLVRPEHSTIKFRRVDKPAHPPSVQRPVIATAYPQTIKRPWFIDSFTNKLEKTRSAPERVFSLPVQLNHCLLRHSQQGRRVLQ